jgi:hypothetical protein
LPARDNPEMERMSVFVRKHDRENGVGRIPGAAQSPGTQRGKRRSFDNEIEAVSGAGTSGDRVAQCD